MRTSRTPHHIQDESTDTADRLSDEAVQAAGTLTESMEYIERARGHLYSFHQLMGHADKLMSDAVTELRAAGYDGFADELSENIVGRDVLPDRWTYQIVEEFDDGYWQVVREFTGRWADEVADGNRHVAEAQMRRDRHTE